MPVTDKLTDLFPPPGKDVPESWRPLGTEEEDISPQYRPDNELLFRDKGMEFALVNDVRNGQPYNSMSRRQRALLRAHLICALEELDEFERGVPRGNGNDVQ